MFFFKAITHWSWPLIPALPTGHPRRAPKRFRSLALLLKAILPVPWKYEELVREQGIITIGLVRLAYAYDIANTRKRMHIPWKNDGWKMMHFFLKWSLLRGHVIFRRVSPGSHKVATISMIMTSGMWTKILGPFALTTCSPVPSPNSWKMKQKNRCANSLSDVHFNYNLSFHSQVLFFKPTFQLFPKWCNQNFPLRSFT